MIKKINLRYLNQMTWYRWVKVVYVGLFALAIIVVAKDSFSVFSPRVDEARSYITCQSGETYQLGQSRLQLQGTKLSAADDLRARRLCLTDEQLGATAREHYQYAASLDMDDAALGQKMRSDKSFIYQNAYLLATPAEQNYIVTPVHVKNSVLATILWLIVPTIIIVGVFELIRRVFYYLVLDTFIPEKRERYLFFKLKS
jgi:hypothetical protein